MTPDQAQPRKEKTQCEAALHVGYGSMHGDMAETVDTQVAIPTLSIVTK